MTTPIGATGASTATAAATSKTTSKTSMDSDAFMKLLVAQLKYQDPMSPADGAQSLSQMATFTQVEKLGQLVTAQTEAAQWQQRLTAASTIGKTVTGVDATGADVTGVVKAVRFASDGPVLELESGATTSLTGLTHLG